jgi:RNA polymerase sigma-70 factor (ECF subfamily)
MPSTTADPESLDVLVSEAQRGSRPAGDRLVRENDAWVRSAVFAVTGRSDVVDDIAQQVWTQVWERLDSLKDPQRLRPWLYSIARNAALDACEARKRRRATDLEHVGDGLSDAQSPSPARIAADGEIRDVLLRAVEALPAIYREPFVLRHLEDWTYQQIGELLGLPVETVETRLVRARRLLREMLKGAVR